MHYMIEWITFGSEEFLHCSVLIRSSTKERFSLLVQGGAHKVGWIISIPSVQSGCFVLGGGGLLFSFFFLWLVHPTIFFANNFIDFCD